MCDVEWRKISKNIDFSILHRLVDRTIFPFLALYVMYQLYSSFMYYGMNDKNKFDFEIWMRNQFFNFFFAEEPLYGKMEDQNVFQEDVTHGLMQDFLDLNQKEMEIVWLFWIMFTKIGLNIMMLLVTIRNLPFANALEEKKKIWIQITLCLSLMLFIELEFIWNKIQRSQLVRVCVF